MSYEEFEAALIRLVAGRELPGNDRIQAEHDFDSCEMRMWKPDDQKKTHIDDKRLWNRLHEGTEPVTEQRIVKLLCDIYRRPGAYPGVVIK